MKHDSANILNSGTVETNLTADAFIKRSTTATNILRAGGSSSTAAYNYSTHLSGASVFDQINVTDGVVQSIAIRNLTAANIGAATSGHTHTLQAVTTAGNTTTTDIQAGDLVAYTSATNFTRAYKAGYFITQVTADYRTQITPATGDIQNNFNSSFETRLQFPTATQNNVATLQNGSGTLAFLSDITGGGSSPLTTKGDLYTYSTVDARLPVGTNGQLLTADSSELAGLKWIASPSLQSVTDTGATTTNPISITNNFFEQLKVSNTAGSDAIIATTAGSNTAGYLKLTNEDGGVMSLTIRHDQLNTNTVTIPGATGRAAIIGTTAPTSASATGVEGEVRVTSTYIYHCIATNTWVRSVAATW